MADWCKYCKGPYGGFFSSYYTCSITGREENVSDSMVKDYCMRNGYNCSRYKQYGPVSGGCFITTITCEILHKEDNDKVMNNLRKFRDEVLQEDDKYYDILKDYDTIGPVVADRIMDDDDKEVLAEFLFNDVLTPISELVSEGKNDLAVEKYYVMTLALINRYGLKHQYNEEKEKEYNYKEFNPKKAGHGRKLVLCNKKKEA